MPSSTTIHPNSPAGIAVGPYWLAGQCPSWCVFGSVHHDSDHPDDRRHMGGRHLVTLSAEAPGACCNGHEWLPADVSLSLQQHYRETEPLVAVSHNDRPGFCMTLAEAREMVLVLAGLVSQAGADLSAQGSGSLPGDCPSPWCARGPHDNPAAEPPGDELHMSSPAEVRAAWTRHHCGYRKGPYAADECEFGVSAWLLIGDDPASREPVIQIAHGDDAVPHMTLGAAEDLAFAIVGLVRTARPS